MTIPARLLAYSVLIQDSSFLKITIKKIYKRCSKGRKKCKKWSKIKLILALRSNGKWSAFNLLIQRLYSTWEIVIMHPRNHPWIKPNKWNYGFNKKKKPKLQFRWNTWINNLSKVLRTKSKDMSKLFKWRWSVSRYPWMKWSKQSLMRKKIFLL
jgi:hypothetical protein